MAGGKIGDFFVQFSAQGFEDLSNGLSKIGAGLGDLTKQAGAAASAFANVTAKAAPYAQASAALRDATTGAAKEVANLTAAAAKPVTLFGLMRTAAAGVAQAMPALGQVVTGAAQAVGGFGAAVQPVTGYLYGWVQAGVMASSAGQILQVHFAELSRQMASVFMPQIKALVTGVQDLTLWFQRLTGAKQQLLRYVGLFVGGLSAAAAILPVIIGMVKGLGLAFMGLRAIILGLNLMMATNPVLLAIMAAAVVLAGIVALVITLTDSWGSLGEVMAESFGHAVDALKNAVDLAGDLGKAMKDALPGEFGNVLERAVKGPTLLEQAGTGSKRLLEGNPQLRDKLSVSWPLRMAEYFAPRKPAAKEELAPAAGGFEDVTATYKRIALASRFKGGMTKDPQQEAVEELKKLAESVTFIKDDLAKRPHAVVR